jgi:Ca-activated chloride channel homolog
MRRRHALAVLAILLAACTTVRTHEATSTPTPNQPPKAAPTPEVAVSVEGTSDLDQRMVEPPTDPAVVAPVPTAPPTPKAEAKVAADDRERRSVDDLLSGALSTGHGVGGGLGNARMGKVHALKRAAGASAVAAYGAPAQAYVAEMQREGNTERYAHKGDNPFEKVADAPLSTFSIDVDTAAYSNVRRFLRDGVRPPADAVRIEELVNYFRYDYPVPASDAPVAVSTEVSTAPWHAEHRVVRIGLRTREIAGENVPASNLVFLIDVSGSMQSPDKLPLLKRGMDLLAQRLRPQDRVSMVVYAGSSGVVLPPTSGTHKDKVREALQRLEAGGSTNGAEGIELAYRVAQDAFIRGGVNRVILATDGDFNVGTTSEGELVRLIEDKRKSGVSLTVLGFGTGNLNDSGMEKLADHGDGNYAYIDSIAEAHKVLVREAGSTLVTVAKDVKLQIEWNPARVANYRLIGFENRMLAARDFNDDKKDAGELGAGHTVTALYEVTLASHGDGRPDVDPLRYQEAPAPSAAADSDELLTVKIRYKRPGEDQSRLMTSTVRDAVTPLPQTSQDFRWAVAVAGFGMVLRDSEHKGHASLGMLKDLARSATGADLHGERHELIALMDRARALGLN